MDKPGDNCLTPREASLELSLLLAQMLNKNYFNAIAASRVGKRKFASDKVSREVKLGYIPSTIRISVITCMPRSAARTTIDVQLSKGPDKLCT